MSKTVKFKLGRVQQGGGKPPFSEVDYVLAALNHMGRMGILHPDECNLDKFAKSATLEAVSRYYSMIRQMREETKLEDNNEEVNYSSQIPHGEGQADSTEED